MNTLNTVYWEGKMLDYLGHETMHKIYALFGGWRLRQSEGTPLTEEQQTCQEVIESLMAVSCDLANENARLMVFWEQAQK
jgi:hypothetical protein